MVEVGASKNEASAPPQARKAAAAGNAFGGMEAPVSRKSNRDDDEAPRSKKRTADDDNDRPRGKRRDDDDDQKPHARKPAPLDDDDDEEDEKPPARKRRVDDDDDDDRPRARKRRDDDDDDDDIRPRKKFKKKKKKSNVGVMIALSVIGLLGLAGAGYLVYWLLSSNNYDTEMMAYLPAETDVMGSIDAEDLMTNEKVKGYVKKFTQAAGNKDMMDKFKQAGITEDDFSRILFGGKAHPGKGDEMLMAVVVRFKKSVDKGKIASAMKTTEKKKNDKSYYQGSGNDNNLYLFFPSDDLMVIASTEKQIDSLTTNSGKVAISAEMQDLGKKLSKGQIWFSFSRSVVDDQLKSVKELKGLIPFFSKELVDAIESMRGGGAYLNVDGDKVTFGFGMLCSESSLASKAAEALNKDLKGDANKNSWTQAISKMTPDLKNGADESQKSLSIDSSGAMLEISASASLTSIEPLIRKIESSASQKVESPQQPPEAQPQPDKQAPPDKQPKKRGAKK
jgi:hypothetical protein